MNFKEINDYELLFLIKEGNEKAYEVIMKKYEPFIKKMSYRFYSIIDDDFLYDGYLVLNEAIIKYDEGYSKTFLKFFELLLARYFCKYIKKMENERIALNEYSYELSLVNRKIKDKRIEIAKQEINNIKEELLKKIILEYINSNSSIAEICKKYGYNSKNVYNKLYQIKRKINKF